MSRTAQSVIDPKFWDRLRQTLQSHMESNGLRQKDLAAQLGLDPTTLNNFLNRDSKTLGGLAVALACTLVDLTCNGKPIGRTMHRGRAKKLKPPPGEQLVLEFDRTFELNAKAKRATLVLRKSASRQAGLRLAIIRIGHNRPA